MWSDKLKWLSKATSKMTSKIISKWYVKWWTRWANDGEWEGSQGRRVWLIWEKRDLDENSGSHRQGPLCCDDCHNVQSKDIAHVLGNRQKHSNSKTPTPSLSPYQVRRESRKEMQDEQGWPHTCTSNAVVWTERENTGQGLFKNKDLHSFTTY